MITKFKIYESLFSKPKPKKDDEIFIGLMDKIKEEIDERLNQLSCYSTFIDYNMKNDSKIRIEVSEFLFDNTYSVRIRPKGKLSFYLEVSTSLIKDAYKYLKEKCRSRNLKLDYETEKSKKDWYKSL